MWGEPFATKFSVQYGHFIGSEDLSQRLPTAWRNFPRGNINNGTGANTLTTLAARPFRVRYVRVRLDEGSGTGPRGSSDIRDRQGFAIREIYVGLIDNHTRFKDAIRHGTKRDAQTTVYVSSTDPWHREIDRDGGSGMRLFPDEHEPVVEHRSRRLETARRNPQV